MGIEGRDLKYIIQMLAQPHHQFLVDAKVRVGDNVRGGPGGPKIGISRSKRATGPSVRVTVSVRVSVRASCSH